ncbi:MAG TPA: hypothetical protein VJQ52_24540 [Steroidobacteraceae bacterium]|nr:hypothetical protein [Steroidobacteraceae bacterium]
MNRHYAIRHSGLLLRALLAVMLAGAFGPAQAHIKNEASQFPDIEFSDARFDIVVLVGVGIIPETPVFEPDKPLSKKELASWAALANGLGKGGETPDTDALAAAAVKQQLVDSLQGDASYADLNTALFGGKLQVEEGAKTPTKAQAAQLIAANLTTDAGRALLERRELQLGTTGPVASVESQGAGHHAAYVITIADVARKMHEHGRVANGPVDLLQWKGRTVRRSVVKGTGADAVWIYIEAEPLAAAAAAPAGQESAGTAEHDEHGAPGHSHEAEEAAAKGPPRSMLYWLIAGVLVLGVALFVRSRRS